jgi:hypothetical protein
MRLGFEGGFDGFMEVGLMVLVAVFLRIAVGQMRRSENPKKWLSCNKTNCDGVAFMFAVKGITFGVGLPRG